ncbi:MAG: hypothetical protein H6658_12750 [Ardenticatenaceae bacterium]|nr:hypothetical protein [Ardenticatenaceae bacterium]
MSDQFEWRIVEEEENEALMNRPASGGGPRLPVHPIWLVLVVVILGGYFVGRQILTRNDESAEALVTAVQDLLDLEHEAYLAGNGRLFLSAFNNDEAWQAAQLLPYNQTKARAGMRVTHAEQFNTNIRADVAWEADGQTWQNIAFFRQQNAQVVHVPPPGDFWGLPQQVAFHWGSLTMHEADWEWQGEIGNFISGIVNEHCPEQNSNSVPEPTEDCASRFVASLCDDVCPQDRFPIRVQIRDDYRDTPLAGEIYVPSPYLMALDENGRPAPIFWQLLQQKVDAYLAATATVRFGIPSEDNVAFIQYQEAADNFMHLNPHITIELVPLSTNPPDPAELVGLDGAALRLTEELITSGTIYDLTDFALGDSTLEAGDFYEQVWLASFWHERMWQVPHVAEMQLIFFDTMAYRNATQTEPTLRWTWAEMAQDMDMVLAVNASEDMVYGYLDITRDTLYSYAYNWKNECTEEATVRCQRPLDATAVTATLEWYQQMVTSGQTPDLTQVPEAELELFMLRSQSLQRQSLFWVEDPVQYEHHLLLNAIGVLPFPGSDRFDGITPLWVRGNVIVQGSERPLVTWEWLKYLSYQPPTQRIRLIPARPSVAGFIGFWPRLPLPLGNAMRTAFPFARPVLIEEQAYFTREQLTAVLTGQMTPAEAARAWPQKQWFNAAPEQ